MLLFVVKGVAQKLEIIHKEDIGKEVEDVDSLLKDVLPQTDKRCFLKDMLFYASKNRSCATSVLTLEMNDMIRK